MVFIPNVIESDGRSNRAFSMIDKLFSENIILLEGGIDADMATSIKAQLLYLDSKEECKEINLYISSGGGSIYDGNGIIDVMKYIKTPVNTICTGIAMSMGLAILSSGTGTRKAMQNSRIMAHSLAGGTQGKFQDMEIDFKESQYLQDKMMKLMSNNTNGKTSFDEMVKMCDRDNFMSPEEAKKIGFIDDIIL